MGLHCRCIWRAAGLGARGYIGARIHYPLIASCAESGDMLGGLLRPGNAAPGAENKMGIQQLVEEAERELYQRAQVRLDAAFPETSAMSGGCTRTPHLTVNGYSRRTVAVARATRPNVPASESSRAVAAPVPFP